jgi:hypothetical protein
MTRPAGPCVVVRLSGGLGNQLFQYAFGRALAVRHDVPLVVDHLARFARDPFYRRRYLLDRYRVACDHVAAGSALSRRIERVAWRLAAWRRRWPLLADRSRIREPDAARFHASIAALPIRGRTTFDGYWQHEEYFTGIRDLLLEDLVLREPVTPQAAALAARLRASDAVTVHVRCGRGLPAGATAAQVAASARLDIDPAYYPRAVARLRSRLDAPRLFVFSDHPEWVRQHVSFPEPAEFVTSGTADGGIEDLWLMSQCSAHVIGNSSFSWWAAWLATNPAKTVIAPRSGIGRGLRSVPPAWELL